MQRDRGESQKGAMTVSEAGKKGGQATSQSHGKEFYSEIGHKGGQKVKELINRGEQAMSKEKR